jgi:hypothetical protein
MSRDTAKPNVFSWERLKRVPVVVVEPVAIQLHAGRIDAELVRRAPIVIRVDQHAHPVARRIVVAPCQIRDDLAGVVVVGADLHEQRRRVVGDAELGPLARLAVVVRLTLAEGAGRRHRVPDFRAQLSLDAHGAGHGGRDVNRLDAGGRGCRHRG